MFTILHDFQVQFDCRLHSFNEGIEDTIPFAIDCEFLLEIIQLGVESLTPFMFGNGEVFETQDFVAIEVMAVEQLPDLVRADFLTSVFRHFLYHATKFNLQPARQLKAKFVCQHISNTALA